MENYDQIPINIQFSIRISDSSMILHSRKRRKILRWGLEWVIEPIPEIALNKHSPSKNIDTMPNIREKLASGKEKLSTKLATGKEKMRAGGEKLKLKVRLNHFLEYLMQLFSESWVSRYVWWGPNWGRKAPGVQGAVPGFCLLPTFTTRAGELWLLPGLCFPFVFPHFWYWFSLFLYKTYTFENI